MIRTRKFHLLNLWNLTPDDPLDAMENEYLLYGCGLKHQIFFKRSEFFFNVKNQREFT